MQPQPVPQIQQTQQPQQVQQTQPPPLKGWQVSSQEEARRAMIDPDGSLFVFPDVSTGAIYTKQINPVDFSAVFRIYHIAQAIPDAATINAPVVITIGTGTVQYPLDPAELRPGDRLRPPDTHPVRGLREHKPHGRLLPAAGQSLLCSRQRPEQHQRNRSRSRRR